jgi:hypothetical protein
MLSECIVKLTLLFVFAALAALAQPGLAESTNQSPSTIAHQPLETSQIQTTQSLLFAQQVEETRQACIEGRRSICGKILKILPDGLVVDSGFTNLLRAPLNRSWLAPGTVSAARSHNLVEGHEPNSICIGRIFLTNLPKSRGAKPRLYDYVMIEGYPAGQFTYTSVGNVQRTVRKFSANLDAAINWQLKTGQNPAHIASPRSRPN